MNNDDKITWERHKEITQEHVDRLIHYRNLAIVLGAKPENMLGDYDRKLCERGIDPNEEMHGMGANTSEQLGELKNLWDKVEELENQLAMAIQVSGELCDKCGWAMKFPSEPCRCELLQALTDIVNPQHNGKDVCSIRCSRCYDPRQIAREALGEDK
jgi:hypothetical protein